MDVVSKLAIEIAREAVPDEIHSAPLMAENFVKGGRHRKELLQQSQSGELGGFGINEGAIFPWILHTMTVASPFLAGLLTSKTLSNSSIIIRKIHSALNPQKSSPLDQAQSNVEQKQEPIAFSAAQDQSNVLPKQLQQCVSSMTAELQKAGMSPQESERVAYKVILVLWQDAPQSILFLKKITEKK